VEAVRLETGFVYIKVVVVTAAESCGKKVKAQFRASITLCEAVGNAAAAVGKDVWFLSHCRSLPNLSL
jgi:hypothetical protein